MDDYIYEWMAKIRWADLRRAADEVALSRSLDEPTTFDETTRWRGSEWVTDGEPRPRRGLCQALALASVMWVWGMGAPLAWGHGGHPHAPAVTEREAAPTSPTAPTTPVQLEARSARFDFDPPRPGSYRLPVVKPAADGAVLDAAGVPRRLRDVLAGRITVLSFVYTRCSDPNGCPLATAVLYQLHGATAGDRELARHLRLVTLSFDPGHDTPETMAKYSRVAATRETRSPWEFLTTTSDRQLGPILAGYGQVVQRSADPSAPGPSHLLRVYLIDRQLRIRNVYGLDFLDPRLLLADVRTLLLEDRVIRR
jgi:cytochrome oxidase Cu insertion factor (SCO1/SenC/PrrC family)